MQSILLVALHATNSCWLQDKSFYIILFGQVTKKQVDKFVVGKRVPSCQLRLEWVGTGWPVVLFHHVTLKGAKEPFNCLAIESDVHPLTQQPPQGIPLTNIGTFKSCPRNALDQKPWLRLSN